MLLQFERKSLFAITSGLFVCTLAFVACKKDKTSEEVQAQLDQSKIVLQANNNLVRSSVLMGQGAREKGSGGLMPEKVDDRCGTISATPIDPQTFPKVITLDYGTGCTDAVGIERAGSVALTLDKIWETGTTSSVEYFNYVENAVTLNGKLSLKNTGTITGAGWDLAAANLTRKEANGTQSSVDGQLSFKQTEGILTFWDWSDDAYQITGNSVVLLANGDQAKYTIDTPLQKYNNCAWVSKGTATLVVNGDTMLVDYGDGTCDNVATVTINGNTYTIYL